jgi:hypothetical protein
MGIDNVNTSSNNYIRIVTRGIIYVFKQEFVTKHYKKY